MGVYGGCLLCPLYPLLLMHMRYLLFAISLRLQAHYRELLIERRREILHESE